MAKKSEETPPAGETKKPASFEEALAQLQEIVRELESGERSLDDSLKLYEQGIASLRACHTLLDQAEQRIKKLVAGAGGKVTEEPFQSDEFTWETAAIAVDPGGISSGPTQVMPAIPHADQDEDAGKETKLRKTSAPRRGRGGKDSSLFND
jgi:exodeoxyribonuclease VII small subunit